MSSAIKVLVWWVLFAGTHTVLSHPPIRSRLVSRLGEGVFQGVYSLIALATFVPLLWTFFTNRSSHAVPLLMLLMTPGIWWLTMLLNLFAVVLLVLGFSRPNPVSSLTAKPGSGSSARGALRITRHPAFISADPELRRFFAETSFFPFVATATGRNRFEPRELRLGALIAGVALFGLVFLFHYRLFG